VAGTAVAPSDVQEGISAGAWIAGALAVVLPLAVLAAIVAVLSSVLSNARETPAPWVEGVGDPYAVRHFGAMYEDAAAAFGVNPYVLMAIHDSESDYGRSTLPGVRDGFNEAGCCAGPTQFLITGGATPSVGGTGGTWAGYADAFADPRVKLKRPDDYPNRFEPHPNVYDSYDAIYATAKYMSTLGAGREIDQRTFQALLRYKGTPPASIPYAVKDYNRAKELEAEAKRRQSVAVPPTPGSQMRLNAEGLVVEVPKNMPQAVRDMVAAANRISNRPYELVHYPTHIDNPTYDCSSSTSHVLWAGGKFGLVPWCSANFVNYGAKDDGRQHWVSVHAKGPCGGAGHVFLVINGMRFDTGGPDHGPNAGEDGPRWRLGVRPDMAQYAVRHPEGL
jgi:hypothetical protein